MPTATNASSGSSRAGSTGDPERDFFFLFKHDLLFSYTTSFSVNKIKKKSWFSAV